MSKADMRALVRSRNGAELRTIPIPKPKPGEVLIEVRIAGLCRTDVYAATGGLEVPEGRVLGHEFSGIVRKLGDGVSAEWMDRSVAVFPWLGCGECTDCQAEPLQVHCFKRRFVGIEVDGCFAEFMVFPTHRLFTLPEGCTFQAGAYAEPLASVLGVLKTQFRAGDKIAVLGDNRIASLTRIVLEEIGGLDLTEDLDSLDVLIETGLSEKSAPKALSYLRPGGTLILKSRPARGLIWPLRRQVEREIRTLALGYGSVQKALSLLAHRPESFQSLWNEPTRLEEWPKLFAAESEGKEERKSFFRIGS